MGPEHRTSTERTNFRRVPELIPRTDVFAIGGVHTSGTSSLSILVTVPC